VDDVTKGTAFLDVTVEAFAPLVDFLPRAYRIIGSAANQYPETVRLLVESDELNGHGHILTCEVHDVGSVRTIVVRPTFVNRQNDDQG
jgi:hypothetical protein